MDAAVAYDSLHDFGDRGLIGSIADMGDSLPRAGRALLGLWRRLGRGRNGRDVAIASQEPSPADPHFESLLEDQVSVEDQAAEGMWRQLIDLPGAWPQIPFCPRARLEGNAVELWQPGDAMLYARAAV